MKTIEYFDRFSNSYDGQQKKNYWLLCNEIIWNKLHALILNNESQISNIVDLGGGTGFWAERIATHFPNISITIIDISEKMLSVAKNKLKSFDNIKYYQSDILDDVKALDNLEFDLCLNIYVSMFVSNIGLLFSRISKYLKKDGHYFFVGQNIHHTIAMLVSNGEIEKINDLIVQNKVKLNDHIPTLYLQDRKQLNHELYKSGLIATQLTSFPNYSRTGLREKMTGKNLSISEVLIEKDYFDKILQLELNQLESNSDFNNMGMYWLSIGVK